MSDIAADYLRKASDGIAVQIEQRIRLAIRPAPRWIPERLWMRIAARFLELQFIGHPTATIKKDGTE